MRTAPVTEDMVQRYLAENAAREAAGDGLVTWGTFVTRDLRGKARDYAVHYARRGDERLKAMLAAGEVETCPSVGGGTAYRRLS